MDDSLHLPTADALTALYANSPLPVLLTDLSLGVAWCNAAALALLPAARALPQPLSGLLQRQLPPDLTERLPAGEPADLPLPTLGRRLVLLPIDSGYLAHLPPMGERAALADFWAESGPASDESFRMNIDSIFSSLLMLKLKSRLYEDEEAYRHLRNINANCFRLLRDSRNLSLYTRLRTRRGDFHLAPCDLTAHLQRLCAALQLELESRTGARFDCTLPKKPVLVMANTELLDIALLNLVGNSLKYGFAEGLQIRLRMQAGESVNLHLSDNGPGAPLGMAEQLYQPFFSLPQAEGEPLAQGLGMTVAREVFELHGGSIFTSTREDGGMEIAIRLPLAESAEGPLQLSSSAAARYNTDYFDRYSPLHILLSDTIAPPMP